MDIEGKLNEPRSANMAVGDATNGNVDEVGTATLALNGKPNQIGGAAVRRLCLPVQS
jgi:sorbitol-specific phosphotransferase system component IIA